MKTLMRKLEEISPLFVDENAWPIWAALISLSLLIYYMSKW